MKRNKLFPLLIYAVILILVFNSIFDLFGSREVLSYSQVVEQFEKENVRKFTVTGDTMVLTLREPWQESYEVTAYLADTEGFRQTMWNTI